MPTIVVSAGIIMMALLLWVYRINEGLRNDSSIVDTIADVQSYVATAHLKLDEVLGGDKSIQTEDIFLDLDRAIDLVDVCFDGGESEHGLVREPLRDPKLCAGGEEVKSMLEKYRVEAEALLSDSRPQPVLGSAADKRLHETVNGVLSKTRGLEDRVRRYEAGRRQQSKRLFAAILALWSFSIVAAAAALWRRETQQKQAEEKLSKANDRLFLQAEELSGHREHLAELVEKRTAELTTANDRLRLEVAHSREVEDTLKETGKQVRHLSSQLLRAQEIERKRLSMALHDELGQALNVIKLEIRVIERGLGEGQQTAREPLEKLLEYLDQIIEDVRGLSLYLSPTVLEDLGLTAALQWLVNNFSRTPAMTITSDITEIDRDLTEDQKIAIYRVVQEALTNIVKHAEAQNASLATKRQDGKIVFSVKDDGKGFDPKRVAMKDPSMRGLGLATMNERVRMMGGVFHLSSQEGKGTSIVFSIPADTGGFQDGTI